VSYTGDIVLPTPGDSVEGGHSMCLVGYVEEPGAPGWGGGRFLVRNSWDRWGIKCRYGKGYGTIPFSYILRYSEEAYSIL
jgi:C1A family cysteine protease